MSQVFVEKGTDGILLIDASNAFNQMNRSVALHNIQIMCKEMALYVINTYRSSSAQSDSIRAKLHVIDLSRIPTNNGAESRSGWTNLSTFTYVHTWYLK